MIIPVNPAQILMRFGTRRCGGSPDQVPPQYFTVTSTPAQSQPGVQIGTEIYTSTCIALFDPADLTSPTNLAQLQKLSDTFTFDYLNWRQTEFDESFVGITAIVPSAIVSFIEWDYNQDICKTRFSSAPDFSPVQELGQWDSHTDMNCPDTDPAHVSDITPCIEMYGPPDTGGSGASTSLYIWKVCKQDGRYYRYLVGEETYPCGCSTGCVTTICVFCSTERLAGATVTIDGVGTQTTGDNGCTDFVLPKSGDYNITIEASGHPTYTANTTLLCGTNNFNICCIITVCPVTGCGDATITKGKIQVSVGSTVVQSSTLGSSGCATFAPAGTGPFTVTISGVPCYPTFTFTATCGNTYRPNIAGISGTPTVPCCGVNPLPNTLFLTDGCGTVSVAVGNGAIGGFGGSTCCSVPSSPSYDPTRPPPNCLCINDGGPSSITVNVFVSCNGDGTYTATRTWGVGQWPTSGPCEGGDGEKFVYADFEAGSCMAPISSFCFAVPGFSGTSTSPATMPDSLCPFAISFTMTQISGDLPDPGGGDLTVMA